MKKTETTIISVGSRKAEIVEKTEGTSKTVHLLRKKGTWTDKAGKSYSVDK